jgi:hypothetical protein
MNTMNTIIGGAAVRIQRDSRDGSGRGALALVAVDAVERRSTVVASLVLLV